MGLLLYRKCVPVLLALAVSGTGIVTAGAASHGGSGTAGVSVTADAGKHAGRNPDKKPAAVEGEGSHGGNGNPGGTAGSGGSAGGGDGESSGGGSTDGGSKRPGSSAGGGEGSGSGGTGAGSSDKDSGSSPDDSAEQGGADGSGDGSSGMGTDGGTGSGAGDGSADSGICTGSGDTGDGSVSENNPGIESGSGGSGPGTASGLQKDAAAEQSRDSADTEKNPDSVTSDDGSTAVEEPENESVENNGPEPGEGSRKNTGILWAAFLAATAAVLAGRAVLVKRRGRRFHGILTDKKEKGVRIVRSRDGTDVFVPALAGKISSGAVSFQDYKELLMGSSSVTVLPCGTKMSVSSTDGVAGRPEDADEHRMLERLGEIADTAHSRGKTVAADVVLWNDRKDFEIRIHYVFR